MTEPKISEAQVRHVARLARLSLGDDEVRAMQAQLGRILDYVASLDALDVREVPPTAHAVPLVAPLREDRVRPSLPREELLAQAPKSEAGGFAVPKVMEGDA
jgi:aspartyl-tRNA(Asn)/glutamyl-tRNA(Gln) amidotransferase subunit C